MRCKRNTWKLALPCLAALVLAGQNGPAGTSDQDHDGIPDQWETNGINLKYPDGSTHILDLKGHKASPGHKDIIVWVDWMGNETLNEGGKHTVHNHKPMDSAIAIVKNAFANAKQIDDNPDGTKGINLIVLVSPNPVPHKDMLGSGDLDDGTVWNDFNPIRDGHFPAQLRGIAHYCLFAHDITSDGRSGLSYDFGAYDFIVSLGQWQNHSGNESEQAGTFMHELGHNLTLHHGGADDLNYKPNYLSIMNYFFQTDGLATPTGQDTFNYSVFAFPDLNELSLNEKEPITKDSTWANWGSAYFCPSDKKRSRTIASIYGTVVDWNCDGQFTTGVQGDINGDDPPSGGGVDLLKSQADWKQIHYIFPPPVPGRGPSGKHSTAELSVAGANRTPLPPAGGLTALAQGTKVRLSWNRVPSSRVRGYEIARIAPNRPAVVFATTDLSYVDTLPEPVPELRYEVHTLFVPHGARELLKMTGTKLEDGLDLLTVGKLNVPVAVRMAERTAVNQLQRNFTSAIELVRARGGMTPAMLTNFANDVEDLKMLLTSQPARIAVKFQ